MNFQEAKHVRDIIWYEGMLLGEYSMRGKTYLVKWADCDDEGKHHTWLVFEVEPEILDLFYQRALTLRQVEDRTPAMFVQEGFIDDGEAAWTDGEEVPEEWLARSNSYYDPILAAMVPGASDD